MDDHAALVERLEGYTGYADADTRALDEERVRAFVGERLALARERLGKELDEATTRRLEAAIYECQFANMLSVRQLLDARLERDLERGATGLGPHLDDVVLTSGTRDLRSFGSQGEQRLTVLALLLAEAELIAERRGFAPLLLLDDVLSELDPDRRRVLAERVVGTGQTLITATEASSLPVDPAQLLEVSPGHARAV
jgi:recombinational DNA repair ATPase RecF